MKYELHIDLLQCEFCSQHNKLLVFCSACGRARTKNIVAPAYKHRSDRQLAYWCPVCYSQRGLVPHCIYCDLKMPVNRNCEGWAERIVIPDTSGRRKPRWGNTKKQSVKKALVATPVRPMEQRYVSGFIRYVYTDTGDVVPGQKPIDRLPIKPKSKYEPTPSIRSRVYARDGGCLRCSTLANSSLHHIIHRAHGGKNTLGNLQTLCRTCHVHIHDVMRLPSGTPYTKDLETDNSTQEDQDREWNRLRRKRVTEKGKKAGNYAYGKGMATNLAAPMIARLRKEAGRSYL